MTKKEKHFTAAEDEEAVGQSPNNIPYIIGVVVMVLSGLLATVVIISLRPEFDIVVVGAVISGFVVMASQGLLTLMKTNATYDLTNHRTSQLIRAQKAEAYNRGAREERERSEARQDLQDEKEVAAKAAAAQVAKDTPAPMAVVVTGQIKTGPLPNPPPHPTDKKE